MIKSHFFAVFTLIFKNLGVHLWHLHVSKVFADIKNAFFYSLILYILETLLREQWGLCLYSPGPPPTLEAAPRAAKMTISPFFFTAAYKKLQIAG